MRFLTICLTTLCLLFSSVTHATVQHIYQIKDIHITHPFAYATVAGQGTGIAHMVLDNQGKQNDALINISTPVATKIEIHNMTMENDVMKMRALQKLVLPAQTRIDMKPHGNIHLMLIGLKEPLTVRQPFPMTLTFKKAGKITVSVWVEQQAP